MKKIGILGSTGSVGTQTLEVVEQNPDKFKIIFLTANSNFELLYSQIKKFKPQFVCINDQVGYKYLKNNLSSLNILNGNNGLMELCSNKDCDIIINSITGYHGLEPTIKIIESGIDIALSNKESIVQAGHLVMELAKRNNVNIFPVDSEHSALWQCLLGENIKYLKKIILTASGGPFRNLPKEQFSQITKDQALNHPNWDMGKKITIDSATMMNKGFELIEAYWLFNISIEKIKIVVHPQSLIHSMVEFNDGSIKAQLSQPDMRLPIQYALTYPERYNIDGIDFSIEKFSSMTFEDVDMDKFKCIKLAYDAINMGNSFLTVLNVSNDLLVNWFLYDKISFQEIPLYIEKAMENHVLIDNPSIEEIKYTANETIKYLEGVVK